MEQLTKEEIVTLANLLANAQVAVKDSKTALELLAKLQRMAAELETQK